MIWRIALLFWLLTGAAALAQPALDGHNTGTSTSGTTVTISATTAANPEIVVVGAAVRATTSSLPSLSISGCSLTWTALGTPSQFVNNSSIGTSIAAWTAKTASNLAACTITITSTLTIQNASAGFCSFSGINTTNAFDPHSGLPVTSTNSTNTASAMSVAMSTTLAHDTMVTVAGQVQGNLGGSAATTGATICANITNSGGLNFSNMFLVYKTFTTPQSAFTIGLNSNQGYYNVIGTALTADAGASGHSRLIQ